jgi:hypothetical protein
VFTWRNTAAIAGVDLVVADDEAAMLLRFSSFVIQVDPDVITGFNVCAFDLKYLIQRMQALRLNTALHIGRRDGSPMRFVQRSAADKVFRLLDGTYGQGTEVFISGRVVHDVLQWTANQYPKPVGASAAPAYSLEDCARHFLNDTKDDVKRQQIAPKFNGSDEDRRVLALSRLHDAQLAFRLMNLLSKNCPQLKPFFEAAIPSSLTIAALSPASSSSFSSSASPAIVNAAASHAITPTSSLPPAVLERIEANKLAAMQRRRAAENAAKLQRHDEIAALVPARSVPAADSQQSSVKTSAAEQMKVAVKRQWGALGAMPDDCDD